MGAVDQPRFLNGAVALETDCSSRRLLDVLLAVERTLGRRRDGARALGPRTIDLDLLLYGDGVLDEPGLTVPHPRLHERRFALEPLAELDPTRSSRAAALSRAARRARRRMSRPPARLD